MRIGSKTRLRVAALTAAFALGIGAAAGLAACGDGETTTTTSTTTTTKEKTVTETVEQQTTTEPTTTTTTSSGGTDDAAGSTAGEYEDCVEQTGNPDFCANLPPGE